MTLRDFLQHTFRDRPLGRALFQFFSSTPTPDLTGLGDFSDRGSVVRALATGGVAVTIGVSLFSVASSALLLAASLAVLYYLLTQVAGLKVDFDPQGLFTSAMRGQSSSSAPN